MKYKILFDFGSEGHSFQDEEFTTINDAVQHAIKLGYHTKFLIVNIVDWEAQQKKCRYSDCSKVHYSDCPTHGVGTNNETK